MKTRLVILSAAASLALAACGSNNNANSGPPGGGFNPGNFTAAVTNLVQQPATGSPVSTNGTAYNNLGTDNAAAFSGVNFGDSGNATIATKACDADPNCKPGIHGPQQ